MRQKNMRKGGEMAMKEAKERNVGMEKSGARSFCMCMHERRELRGEELAVR